MSVAINSLIQRKAGQPSEQREAARNAAPTIGHTQGEQGLCAHSLGDTWPYRVVGKPDDTWEVCSNHTQQRMVGMCIIEAHALAGYLARNNGRYGVPPLAAVYN